MEIKIIKNEKDYEEALKYIEMAIDNGVKKNSEEAEKLEVIITLVQDYEARMFPDSLPDPIEALEYVMEQRSISQEELVAYIGSRSKVSEILARKRPLSLNMIRALHDGLGIPAEVLLNQPRPKQTGIFDYSKFPVKEMIKRGYIKNQIENIEKELELFFQPIKQSQNALALLNRTYYVRSPRSMNQYALIAWANQVINKADDKKTNKEFTEKNLTLETLKHVVDMSDEENAILKVRNFLNDLGIILIVEPHLPQTYLDGAAIMFDSKKPIIGVTIRKDSLDNFWFTLMHELSHIKLHYGKGTNLFYDDTESFDANDSREEEADRLALEIMIPEKDWTNSPASILPSPDAANLLARKLSIHPAIVAGRMRYEKKHYHFLNSLIGKGEIRKLFPEITWSK